MGTLIMETRLIILICFTIFLVICAIIVTKLLIKDIDNRTYVYTKTGESYSPMYWCKLKCPVTGEWYDAVFYKGVKDGKYYAREKNDFFNKFVKLKDWRDGNNSK